MDWINDVILGKWLEVKEKRTVILVATIKSVKKVSGVDDREGVGGRANPPKKYNNNN